MEIERDETHVESHGDGDVTVNPPAEPEPVEPDGGEDAGGDPDGSDED